MTGLGIYLRENKLIRRYALPAAGGAGDYDKKRKRAKRLPFSFRDGRSIEPTVINLDLGSAETGREIEFNGNIVFFAKSTNSTDTIYVRYGSRGADRVPFLPGQSIDGVPYEKIYISWDAITDAAGTLILMRDHPQQDVTVT